MSWIALDDTIGAIHHLLYADDVRGPVNLTAPEPVPQAEFARTLGHVLHRPSFAPLPAFVVKAMFGEMGENVLLGGQRVIPRRLQEQGFTFLRPRLEDALRFELGRPVAA
jgi:NAD dependent epimerase/dehydratase family enzyme